MFTLRFEGVNSTVNVDSKGVIVVIYDVIKVVLA